MSTLVTATTESSPLLFLQFFGLYVRDFNARLLISFLLFASVSRSLLAIVGHNWLALVTIWINDHVHWSQLFEGTKESLIKYWDISFPYQTCTIPIGNLLGTLARSYASHPYLEKREERKHGERGRLSRPSFEVGDVIRKWQLSPRRRRHKPGKPWCWILSLWLPVLRKNKARDISSSFALRIFQ